MRPTFYTRLNGRATTGRWDILSSYLNTVQLYRSYIMKRVSLVSIWVRTIIINPVWAISRRYLRQAISHSNCVRPNHSYDPLKMFEIFVNYVSTVCTPPMLTPVAHEYESNVCVSAWYMFDAEVVRKACNLNSSMSAWPDNIIPAVLKSFCSVIAPHISLQSTCHPPGTLHQLYNAENHLVTSTHQYIKQLLFSDYL